MWRLTSPGIFLYRKRGVQKVDQPSCVPKSWRDADFPVPIRPSIGLHNILPLASHRPSSGLEDPRIFVRGAKHFRNMADQQQKEIREARVTSAAKSLADFLGEPDDCAAWIGSGLSMDCGYPSWEDTIRELCEACIEVKADTPPSLVSDDWLEWC